VTSGEQNTTGSLPLANDMASSRRAHNTIVTDDEFLHAICCANLYNELCNLRVPVPSISANDQRAAFDTFGDGEEDRSDEGFRVVILLEDLDLLTKTRAVDC
jgi:hypothetical protein